MSPTINIENFYDPEDLREHIRHPFQLDGQTIATNGYVLLVMPEHGDYPACDHRFANKVREDIKSIKSREFTPFAHEHITHKPVKINCIVCGGVGKAAKHICEECDGCGEVKFSNSHNSYECDCKTCDGTGYTTNKGGDTDCHNCAGSGSSYPKGSSAIINQLTINPAFLDYIINEPGLEVSVDTENHKLYFKAGESCGIIMGKRA